MVGRKREDFIENKEGAASDIVEEFPGGGSRDLDF